MNIPLNAIANRLRLRAPQRESLEILARVCELLPLEKESSVTEALEKLRAEFPQVSDFERDFPSLCFALATGVGKTRLMGAFIAYLAQSEGFRHFFVLAPNLTIYNKLITDFTPNTPKYVFQGIAEFATNPPLLITGDNYEQGRGIRPERRARVQRRMFLVDDTIHINIFNISKINSEVRGDKAPRIKRLSEYIGESYFEYLAALDDLVLLMDESHRYRATAGVKAINELRPVLGLELTATPQVEKGTKTEPFRNVIYSYPLAQAMRDGFIKEPAVATRENFQAGNYSKEALERLKLEDAIRVHEETKSQLCLYARENNRPEVKPFVLVVAEDTTHASALKALIEDDAFFGGAYRGRVIEVHSQQKGVEKDENVQQLLAVEQLDNPVEIVIHVNMLKEGWDVTNLYTIVPLRAAKARNLVEQSIGRGLRLPYGQRTGVPAVDRLTIISHDRFQEIIDEANRTDSIIRSGVIIGRDIPEAPTRVVTAVPSLVERLVGAAPLPEGSVAGGTGTPAAGEAPAPLFRDPAEQEVALATVAALQDFEQLSSSADLRRPEIQQKLVARVTEMVRPTQRLTVEQRNALSIDIPRIIVTPRGSAYAGFHDFDLDCAGLRPQPVSQEILIQHLQSAARHWLMRGAAVPAEARLEDYLVRGLMDFDDICYVDHAALLYKLAEQMVRHLQSYLKNPADVENVLQSQLPMLVRHIHTQMQTHYEERATEYDVKVSRSFINLRPNNYGSVANEPIRHFRDTVENRLAIRGMLFTGFKKSLYSVLKFHSNSERLFAIVLENDPQVLKWLKPAKGDFRIYHSHDDEYIPDFVVETADARYLCEPKASNELDDPVVQAKTRAATLWCARATEHAGGKPWKYVLIPHDAIDESKTLGGLVAGWGVG
jgi:type III restriction enzyme